MIDITGMISSISTKVRRSVRIAVRASILVVAIGTAAACGLAATPERTPLLASMSDPSPNKTATPIADPIACGGQPGLSADEVLVYFGCGPRPAFAVAAVVRPTNAVAIEDRLADAFEQLTAGPSAEETSLGFTSSFSAATAGSLNDVDLGDDGLLVVDFADFSAVVPNASTAAGSRALLAEIRGTAFQFAKVKQLELRFDGSCGAFFAWIGATCQRLSVPPR